MPVTAWVNVSRSTSLLGFCVLLRMKAHFETPPSNENCMMVVLSASLMHKSGILFHSLSTSFTALLSLSSTPLLKPTSSNTILIRNSFFAAPNNLEFYTFRSPPLPFSPSPQNLCLKPTSSTTILTRNSFFATEILNIFHLSLSTTSPSVHALKTCA